MIVIKKITRAGEYDNATLRDTCVFHALSRADETDDVNALGGHLMQELRSKEAVGAALREGRTVYAVYDRTIEIPVVLDDVQPVNSGKTYAAAAKILVRLNVGREFDSWVRQQFANPFRRKFSDAKLVRALILSGIGNDFRTLFNKEKEELLLKYGVNSTDFPELGENLRGWCSVVKVVAFQPELQAQPRSEFFNGIKAEVERILKPTFAELLIDVLEDWGRKLINSLKNSPSRVLGIVVALVVAAFIVRGCVNANARREAEAEAKHRALLEEQTRKKNVRDAEAKRIQMEEARKREEAERRAEALRPVPGSVSIECPLEGDAAADMLRRDAESHIAELFSKRGIPWSSGKEAKLVRAQWAELLREVRDFANNSDGEFSYRDISDTSASVVLHPNKVKSFVFDVTRLNGDKDLVSEIKRIFKVTFPKGSVTEPVPVRKKAMIAAMREVNGGHKVKVERVGEGRLMFVPDYQELVKGLPGMEGLTVEQIIEKAKVFWDEEAAEKFKRYPKTAASLEANFKVLDQDCTNGFEKVECGLREIMATIDQETVKALAFLAKCDERWLLFTAPDRRPQQMARVDRAVRDMKSLKGRTEARWQNVEQAKIEAARKAEQMRIEQERKEAHERLVASFDSEIATFEATRTAWINVVAELILTNNSQIARKNALTTTLKEIIGARDRRDFNEIAAFSNRIEGARAKRLAVAKTEDMIAQRVLPKLAFPYVDGIMGAAWAKRMKKGFAGLEGAAATVDDKVARFELEVINCFCPVGTRNRTLARALERAQTLAENVRYNHDAKSVRPKGEPPSGTEVDLIAQCDTALASLVRAQRKAMQQTR